METATGISFRGEKATLQHALVHPSVVRHLSQLNRGAPTSTSACTTQHQVRWDQHDCRFPHQFERLEWLGDAALEVFVSEQLYHRFPMEAEGLLSARRSMLVNNEVLGQAAERLGLCRALLHDTEAIAKQQRPRGADDGDAARKAEKWKADAFEALVAAIYLEGGYETLRTFLKDSLIEGLEHPTANGTAASLEGLDVVCRDRNASRWRSDALAKDQDLKPASSAFGALAAEHPAKKPTQEKHPKTVLQEALQGRSMGLPEYVITSSDQGRIVVECRVAGLAPCAGRGSDFRSASAVSALEMLLALEAVQTNKATAVGGSTGNPRHGACGEVNGTGAGSDSTEVVAERGKHPKTLLNEFIHGHPHLGKLEFTVVEDKGAEATKSEPDSRFAIAVKAGSRTLSVAKGRNHKMASSLAAEQALQILLSEHQATLTKEACS